MALVLLDRDGTIIEDKHYLCDPDGVELLPGATQGLAHLLALGFDLAVVTNQSGVGRGYYTEEDVAAVNARLMELLAQAGIRIQRWYHCPHAPQENCTCRKPAPGMAETAMKDFGVDADQCAVIGDKPADVNLARQVGALSVLVTTGKGAASVGSCEPDHVADDLLAAARWLASRLNPS